MTITESQMHTLGAVRDSSFSPTAFDIGLDLHVTTQQAAARLRAAERKGWVESWRPPPEYVDPNLYWRLTPAGWQALGEPGPSGTEQLAEGKGRPHG